MPDATRRKAVTTALTGTFKKKIAAVLGLLLEPGRQVTRGELDDMIAALADDLVALVDKTLVSQLMDAQQVAHLTALSAGNTKASADAILARATAYAHLSADPFTTSQAPTRTAAGLQGGALDASGRSAPVSEDEAHDDFMATHFGTERQFDPHTHQRYPVVRVAPAH